MIALAPLMARATTTLFRSPLSLCIPSQSVFVDGRADVNGDGKVDLLMRDSGGRVGVHLGNGDATFGPALAINMVGGLAATGDLDTDGRPALVIGNANSTRVFLNNGDGSFLAGTTLTIDGNFGQIRVAD